jgi:hypothetical protein
MAATDQGADDGYLLRRRVLYRGCQSGGVMNWNSSARASAVAVRVKRPHIAETGFVDDC